MRTMAQMGAVGTMMDILANATFHLGDVNPKDGKLSKAEAKAFVAEHLTKEGAPLGITLGLHGGHLPLSDDGHVASAIDAFYAKCDADADGHVGRHTPLRIAGESGAPPGSVQRARIFRRAVRRGTSLHERRSLGRGLRRLLRAAR